MRWNGNVTVVTNIGALQSHTERENEKLKLETSSSQQMFGDNRT